MGRGERPAGMKIKARPRGGGFSSQVTNLIGVHPTQQMRTPLWRRQPGTTHSNISHHSAITSFRTVSLAKRGHVHPHPQSVPSECETDARPPTPRAVLKGRSSVEIKKTPVAPPLLVCPAIVDGGSLWAGLGWSLGLGVGGAADTFVVEARTFIPTAHHCSTLPYQSPLPPPAGAGFTCRHSEHCHPICVPEDRNPPFAKKGPPRQSQPSLSGTERAGHRANQTLCTRHRFGSV